MSKVAFVTGGTGLFGSNLIRLLLQQSWHVRALVRSREKASRQLGGLQIEIVVGDITQVESYRRALEGVDAVFHAAAYFRESFQGGSHWKRLYSANVEGTRNLLAAAYDAGVRRFLQTSSIAVLTGPRNAVIDESMLRPDTERDDYYRSKIFADREVTNFLGTHPNFFAVFILPGWMHGPGDVGPTSAGQTTLDFIQRKLPGIPPGTVSFVDVRDAAAAALTVLKRGRRGERYLAAGMSMTISEVFAELEAVTGIAAPQRKLPLPMLYLVAVLQDFLTRLTRKPALLSLATVRLMAQENGRTDFSDRRFREELGLTFRPIRETLRDEIAWFQANGFLPSDK